MLYFLLTGQAPFVGQTANEVWDRARRCDFEAGALRAAKVPRRLERICLKAMAADPADRYASAEELQQALQGYLAEPRVRAAVAGVCGLALLAGCRADRPDEAQRVAPARSSLPRPRSHPARSHPRFPIRSAPIKGRMNLLVVKSSDGSRRRLRLQDPGAVPVRAGTRSASKPGSTGRRISICSGSARTARWLRFIPGRTTTGRSGLRDEHKVKERRIAGAL